MTKEIAYTVLLIILLASCSRENAVIPVDESTESSSVLSSNVVKTFALDGEGQMWIGTSYGLNRYDGHNFTHYYNNSDTTSIPNNNILKLFTDSRHRLWVGTHHGLALSDGAGRFRRFHAIRGEDNDIREIVELADGRIIAKSGTVGTPSIVYLVDTLRHQLRIIYQTKKYVSISAGEHGDLWVNDQNDLIHFDAAFRQTGKIHVNDAANVCFSVVVGRKMWVAQNEWLTGVDLRTGKVCLPSRQLSGGVTYVAPLDANTVALKTFKGWLLLDARSYNIREQPSLGEPDIHLVTNIYRDSRQNLWIGYYDNGFDVFNPTQRMLSRANNNMLFQRTADSKTACLTQAGGKIWGCTYTDIFSYDPSTNAYATVSQDVIFPSNRLFRQLPRKITIEGDRAAILSHGSLVMARVAGQSIRPVSNILSDGYFGDCVLAGDKAYVTANSGFWEFDDNGGKRSYAVPDSLYDNDSKLLLLGGGRILIITRGLHCIIFDQHSRQLQRITMQGGDNSYIQPMATASAGGKVWIGTNGDGLFTVDLKARRLEVCPSSSGLHIVSLAQQGHQLWMGTINGLAVYDINNNGTRLLNTAPAKHETYNAISENSLAIMGSTIYLGTAGGCVAVPDSLLRQPVSEYLHLTGLYTRNGEHRQRIVVGNGDERVVLPHRANDLSIVFADASYSMPWQIVYEYRMEGLDNGWSVRQSPGEISYSGLPTGTYRFRLRAVMAPRGKVLAEKTILLTVKPAPEWSAPAIVLYAIVVIIIIYWLNRLYLRARTSKIQFQQERTERQREQYTNEMNVSFFANISHEFRNPLTLIYSPLSTLYNDETLTRQAHRSLAIVMRSVRRMLRLIDQMLDFNMLDKDALRLSVAQVDIMDSLRQMIEMLRESARYKNIDVETKGIGGSLFGWIDQDKLEKILGNLFTNALTHTGEDGRIMIAVAVRDPQPSDGAAASRQQEHRQLRISLSYSGENLTQQQIDEIFMRYYERHDHAAAKSLGWDTGIGLYYVRRLVELHHGTITVRNIPGEGVAFDVTLPTDRDDYTDDQLMTVNTAAETGLNDTATEKELHDQSADAADKYSGKPVLYVICKDVALARYLYGLFEDKYIVVNKYSTETAMTEMEVMRPEIIIADIHLNNSSGLDLTRTVRNDERYCDIPIILLSGEPRGKEEVRALEAGANACLTKPFDAESLCAVVESQLMNCRLVKKAANARLSNPSLSTDSLSTADRRFMSQLVELMDKHLAESDLHVPVLARELLVSPAKFNYTLKALTGETPGNFFRRYKLEKAAKLLLETDDSVSEIAQKTGFATTSYFSTMFKKKFNMSPSEYRSKG